MARTTAGRCRRREITTTQHYDDQISEVMRRRGINRSEAYRYMQGLAEARTLRRQQADLVKIVIEQARAIEQEGGQRFAGRAWAIMKAATEVLALL